MTSYLMHTQDPHGSIITVGATMIVTAKGVWQGCVTSLPFTDVTVSGSAHDQARLKLARTVMERVQAGVLPLAPEACGAVRILSTSIAEIPRGGDSTGPMIHVPAIADRENGTWRIWADQGAGALAHQEATGNTLTEARDGLGSALMMALEVGIEGLPQDWSGIRLMTTTRKTYPASVLTG